MKRGKENLSAERPERAAARIETDVGVDVSAPEQSAVDSNLSFYFGTPEPTPSAPLTVALDMEPVEPGPLRRPRTRVFSPDWSSWEEVDTPEEDKLPAPKPKLRLRQLMVLMERSFFALSKTRMKPIDHIRGDGSISVRVEAGPAGMATIYDADVLIFLIGKLSEEAQAGQTALLHPKEFFEAVGSTKGGDQYRLLEAALDRLLTTKITTNAKPDGKPGGQRKFRWLDAVTRVSGGWEVQLNEWVREGAQSNFVLSVSPEYFGLGGLERFLYLKARKHTGRSFGRVFEIGSDTLLARSGSAGKEAKFKHEVQKIVMRNELPDYCLTWRDGGHGNAALIEMHRDDVTGPDRIKRGPRI